MTDQALVGHLPWGMLGVSVGLTLFGATLFAGLLARSGFPLPPADRRIGCIDGLRGYLALSVMVHHFVIWSGIAKFDGVWGPPGTNLLNQLGAGAVGLFFMTTGLVFHPRVLQGWRANRWRTIYVGRVFRIVPLIAVSVGAIILVIAARTGNAPDLRDLKPIALWISSWSQPPLLGYPDSGRLNAHVLWSLWHEWLFYLLILPACALARDLARGRLPSWSVPTGLLAAAFIVRGLPLPRHFQLYLPLFAIGMLAGELRTRPRAAALLRHRATALAAAIALAVGAISAPDPLAPLQLALFGFFFVCVACGNDLFGLLATSGARVLGECSYGIYLLHGLALNLLFVDGAALVAAIPTDRLSLLLPVAAVVVVAATATTYLIVERPAIRLGQRVSRRWRRRGDSSQGGAELEVAP